MYFEIIDRQNEIIKSQADIITELYALLSQYTSLKKYEQITENELTFWEKVAE